MDSGSLAPSLSVLVHVQARIFEVVASNTVLAGALHDLARQFGVAPGDFLDCLEGLARAGWITLKLDTESLLRIHLKL